VILCRILMVLFNGMYLFFERPRLGGRGGDVFFWDVVCFSTLARGVAFGGFIQSIRNLIGVKRWLWLVVSG
jgi:hypothetical protein